MTFDFGSGPHEERWNMDGKTMLIGVLAIAVAVLGYLY